MMYLIYYIKNKYFTKFCVLLKYKIKFFLMVMEFFMSGMHIEGKKVSDLSGILY
jgi:hypothetical protein